jgi:hypothetical protein
MKTERYILVEEQKWFCRNRVTGCGSGFLRLKTGPVEGSCEPSGSITGYPRKVGVVTRVSEPRIVEISKQKKRRKYIAYKGKVVPVLN